MWLLRTSPGLCLFHLCLGRAQAHSQLWSLQLYIVSSCRDFEMSTISCHLVFRNRLSSSFKVSEVSILLSPDVLVSPLPLVVHHCRMPELRGTLNIIQSNPSDKEIAAQKLTQCLPDLWEGDFISRSPQFSSALRSCPIIPYPLFQSPLWLAMLTHNISSSGCLALPQIPTNSALPSLTLLLSPRLHPT